MRPHLSLLLVGLALAGCDNTTFGQGHGGSGSSSTDGGSTADGGGEDTAPPSTQDWCGVQAVFDSKCTTCHSGSSPAGSLDLTDDAHDDIVGVKSALYSGHVLVVAGSAEDSFLLAKVENTHDPETEGDPMPPGSGLSSEYATIVRTWIEEGATHECDEGGDGGAEDGGAGDGGSVEPYHPTDYKEPTVHGMEAKLADQLCTDCHGADLGGSGDADSCDSCHTPDDPPAWRTDCTWCHGGVDNSTGAPPETIRDEVEDTSFGAHTHHVTDGNHVGLECSQCHVQPTDVLSSGHLWDGTAGQAELDFSGGLATAAEWTAESTSCSNVYCHSNGQDGAEATGTVAIADAPLACNSCHASAESPPVELAELSGQHAHHISHGIGCQDCHMDTVGRDGSIVDATLHVNGARDIALEHADTMTFDPKTVTCEGECHREKHLAAYWWD